MFVPSVRPALAFGRVLRRTLFVIGSIVIEPITKLNPGSTGAIAKAYLRESKR